VATVVIDGISTRYEVVGTGAPLLMFSPGGFDATLDKWTTLGVYARIKVLEHLSRKYACIVFDRRETGHSGGRVERITWAHYVAQARGLLDHLNIDRAHIMGGCMGCSSAIAFGVTHRAATLSLLLWWPVGGAKYRINGHRRFAEHVAFVRERGLDEVVALAQGGSRSFGEDPRGGPWVSVLRRDAGFADAYVRQNVDAYLDVVVRECDVSGCARAPEAECVAVPLKRPAMLLAQALCGGLDQSPGARSPEGVTTMDHDPSHRRSDNGAVTRVPTTRDRSER